MEHANSEQLGFYLERAREAGKGALELGCGTGVVAVALALAGVDVVGLDPSEALIAQAQERRKALDLPSERCRFEQSDLRAARLSRRFGFVYAPSDALLALPTLEDLEAVFATALVHLEKGGSFAFDLRQLASSPDGRRPQRSVSERRVLAARRPHLMSRKSKGHESLHRLTLLAPSAEEVSAALTAAGFTELERWGGFGGKPFEPGAERLIVVAAPQ